MEKFRFRTAENSDIPKITELVKKCLSEFDLEYSPHSSEKDLINIEDAYHRQGGTFEVMESDDLRIVATAGLLKIDEHKVKLRKMYVDQQYRGRGLGKMLMERMLRRATELGFSGMRLETVPEMVAAIALYRSFGFTQIQDLKAESPRCSIVMYRELILKRDSKKT